MNSDQLQFGSSQVPTRPALRTDLVIMTSTKTDSTSSSTSLCPSHHTAHKLQPSLSPPSISTSTIDPPISNEDVGSETSNDDPHVVMKRRRELSPSTPPISHPAREVILDDIGDEHEVVLETSEVCEENAIALDSRRGEFTSIS